MIREKWLEVYPPGSRRGRTAEDKVKLETFLTRVVAAMEDKADAVTLKKRFKGHHYQALTKVHNIAPIPVRHHGVRNTA